MGSFAGFVVRHAVDVVWFVGAWCVLALIIGFGYGQVCRWADRRAVREREMREILTLVGRLAQEDRLARMLENTNALVSEVQDARAVRRILRDVRRAPLVAVEDIDRMAG